MMDILWGMIILIPVFSFMFFIEGLWKNSDKLLGVTAILGLVEIAPCAVYLNRSPLTDIPVDRYFIGVIYIVQLTMSVIALVKYANNRFR